MKTKWVRAALAAMLLVAALGGTSVVAFASGGNRLITVCVVTLDPPAASEVRVTQEEAEELLGESDLSFLGRCRFRDVCIGGITFAVPARYVDLAIELFGGSPGACKGSKGTIAQPPPPVNFNGYIAVNWVEGSWANGANCPADATFYVRENGTGAVWMLPHPYVSCQFSGYFKLPLHFSASHLTFYYARPGSTTAHRLWLQDGWVECEENGRKDQCGWAADKQFNVAEVDVNPPAGYTPLPSALLSINVSGIGPNPSVTSATPPK